MRRQVLDWVNAIQWPAMVVTVWASWLVASQNASRREWGFWVFLASNMLWIAWGWYTSSWALVVLQFCLIFMNVRGALKNDGKG
jgi:hypothetical protein